MPILVSGSFFQSRDSTPPASTARGLSGSAPTSTIQRQRECPTKPTLFGCAQLIASHHPGRAVDKMDPLSITVSCLTLIGVAGKTSLAVTTFIRGCRDARSDLTAISGELTQLQLVLGLLKDDTDVTDDRIIPQSLQAQILSIIANCSDVVDKINKVLQKHAGKAGPVKWTAFGKTEAEGLRMSLEAHRGSLSLVLELISVSLSKAIKEDTAATRADVRNIKQDTSHIPQIMAELRRLRAIVAVGDVQFTTQNQNYMLERYLDDLASYAETVCEVELVDPPQQNRRSSSTTNGTRTGHQIHYGRTLAKAAPTESGSRSSSDTTRSADCVLWVEKKRPQESMMPSSPPVRRSSGPKRPSSPQPRPLAGPKSATNAKRNIKIVVLGNVDVDKTYLIECARLPRPVIICTNTLRRYPERFACTVATALGLFQRSNSLRL